MGSLGELKFKKVLLWRGVKYITNEMGAFGESTSRSMVLPFGVSSLSSQAKVTRRDAFVIVVVVAR